MDVLGNYLWVIWGIFLVISIILKSIKLTLWETTFSWGNNKTTYLLIGDFFGAIIEVFVGIVFLNPGLASKKLFATLILIICGYKITKMALV